MFMRHRFGDDGQGLHDEQLDQLRDLARGTALSEQQKKLEKKRKDKQKKLQASLRKKGPPAFDLNTLKPGEPFVLPDIDGVETAVEAFARGIPVVTSDGRTVTTDMLEMFGTTLKDLDGPSEDASSDEQPESQDVLFGASGQTKSVGAFDNLFAKSPNASDSGSAPAEPEASAGAPSEEAGSQFDKYGLRKDLIYSPYLRDAAFNKKMVRLIDMLGFQVAYPCPKAAVTSSLF